MVETISNMSAQYSNDVGGGEGEQGRVYEILISELA